jgi:hypothetical protein
LEILEHPFRVKMPRIIPVISAEKIPDLEPSDVSLSWATSIPSSTGLRDCEVRLAKEAAAAAGFDLVTITYMLPAGSPSLRFRLNVSQS